MREIWEKIAGYNYSVSTIGRVRNDRTGKILSPWISSYGYPIVTLWSNKKILKCPIHRLVATSFIPNPDNKPCVDHINTIPGDNRVENLRWVTYQENSRNPITLKRLHRTTFKNGDENPKTMTGKFGHLSPVSKPVLQIKDGHVIREHECARRAMFATGIDCGSITKCCRWQRKTAGGYHWEYKQEDKS